ncbi:MAG: DUF4266 domain-containing protein [Burkholderiales bacterium]|nr:MAG: DUF4266 domain-containing protein [Burkholderiales bacterium]
MSTALSAVALCGAALLAGCASSAPVQPWEKGELARPEMRMDDAADARIADKAFASREAASGSGRIGGGGCGCN